MVRGKRQAMDSAFVKANASLDSLLEKEVLDNGESYAQELNEVMFDVDYTDTKAFRTIFKKITGLTPIENRNKFNKQTVT